MRFDPQTGVFARRANLNIVSDVRKPLMRNLIFGAIKARADTARGKKRVTIMGKNVIRVKRVAQKKCRVFCWMN